ncbi:MAG: methionyl-tRNA formyltransferase [Gemmatimonadota bacterium]|nr:methionyl-tRNA formyltransferase [Gemmatimonadota bacterium]
MAEARRGLRVLFWGTPDFGIPTLEAIRDGRHELVGVVTNPDRPAGRGRRVTTSAVKDWASSAGLPVLQPERPRGDEFVRAMSALAPDISVVAAYGQLLREDILELPRHGSINVHASILPRLRGAAPVNWAIIRGDDEAGVSIMRMVLALDAGPVLRIARCPVGPDTTAGELYARLSELGGGALAETLDDIAEGRAVETPQDDDAATYAPKLDRATARLDWSADATELSRWIRGCDPWPAAWTTLDGEAVQCFAPRPGPSGNEPAAGDAPPGTIVRAGSGEPLLVSTGSGLLEVGEVRPAGKRRMSAGEWVRGRREVAGARFE